MHLKPHIPRISIRSLFRLNRSKGKPFRLSPIPDMSSDITAISFPRSPIPRKGAKLHAYIRQLVQPLLSGFGSRSSDQRQTVPSELRGENVDEETPVLHTSFQPQRSPSVVTRGTETTSPFSDATAILPLEDDRAILLEQDAALEQALKADQELLERIRRERAEEQERMQKILEEERRIMARNQWRRWARRALIPPNATEGGVKFAVRLPSAQRCVGTLPKDASLEHLHILVETFLIPAEYSPEDDPEQPPQGYAHRWEFRLVTSYKRATLPNDNEARIQDAESLQQGGVLLIMEEMRKDKASEDETE